MSDKIKHYTDEHIARAVVRGLRRRGVDVQTVSEAGMLGATDEEHLRFATEQQRVVFTQDDDFLRLHADGISHHGIV
jgi:predicted nuclease of predicted toxin-antitoxin system